MYNEILKDRMEAGFLFLKKYQDSNTVVRAIPGGGVRIGYEILKRLHLPLNIVLSKKMGHPFNKELTIGTVSVESIIVDEHPTIPKEYIEIETVKLKEFWREKQKLYRDKFEPIAIEGKNVIIVDDGIATGNILLVRIAMLRKKDPAKIIVSVPALPHDIQKKSNRLRMNLSTSSPTNVLGECPAFTIIFLGCKTLKKWSCLASSTKLNRKQEQRITI